MRHPCIGRHRRRLLVPCVSLVHQWICGMVIAVVAVLPVVAQAQGGPLVGKLNILRDVLVSKAAVTTAAVPQFGIGKQGQGVFSGQAVRTLKRSQAEVVFNDRSAIRINERTDLIVQDEETLRRIQLKAGIVWVRVARGVNTQVETPSATAVARGTVFTVQQDEDGSTILTVYEGVVEMRVGDQSVPVAAGSRFTVKPGATPTLVKLTSLETPAEFGGSFVGWWNQIADNAGLAVTTGTDALYDLRTSIIGEAAQALQAARSPFSPNGDNSFFINDPAQRREFLRIVQHSLIPDVKNSGLSLSAYKAQFRDSGVNQRFEFSAADAAFLSHLGVKTVGDYVNATAVNGANLNVKIDTSREYYRLTSVTGQPNYDFRLLDRTESNGWFIGVGAAAALLSTLTQDKTVTFLAPRYEISASGFALSPDVLVGGRANVKGRLEKTRYEVEGNLLSLIYGDPKDTFAKLLSVAVVDQEISRGVRIYAGRRRFYHGPTFLNENLSQLIAERYTGAGITLKQGVLSFDGGYIYDANPDVAGAQHGGLGSLFYQAGDGQFGVHYLRTAGLRDGNGLTMSGSYRLLPGVLEVYGEFGRGPDKATLQTYGAYLPGVFQRTDADVFIEYGSHQGVSNSLTVAALKDARKNVSFRIFADFAGRERGVSAGLGGVYRWGN